MIEIKVLSVRSPNWSNAEKSTIDCYITTNTTKVEIPFTASPYNVEQHGREVFFQCIRGDYGPIGEGEGLVEFSDAESIDFSEEMISLLKFIDYVNLENARGSFRSVAILWAAYLDDCLRSKLIDWYKIHRARPSSDNLDFYKVINKSAQKNIINKSEKKKMHLIRLIRNEAAHNWQFSLSTNGVKSKLNQLYKADHQELVQYHDDLDFLIQQIYSPSCAMIAMKLFSK